MGDYIYVFCWDRNKKQTKKTTKKNSTHGSWAKIVSPHKSRTRVYPAQRRPGEQDVTTKLLVVLQHWVPLCVTVDNLFTLVRITSQVRQPVNPPRERWFGSTSGTLQTPLGQSLHGQLIPYNVPTAAAPLFVWATQIDTHLLIFWAFPCGISLKNLVGEWTVNVKGY